MVGHCAAASGWAWPFADGERATRVHCWGTSDFAQAHASRLCAAGRLIAFRQEGKRIAEAGMADAPLREDGPDAAEVRLNRLLNLILEAAVEALGFDAATVSARHDQDVATIGATDQRYLALDDAQYETGEGPCLAVLDQREAISLDDAGEVDDRWEHFARTAAHLGVRSSLSVHLPVDSDGLAASLNLYSRQHMALSDDQVAAA